MLEIAFKMLPDFIIIGGMKCGTSSLFHYLKLHPQVGMSDIKEVDYFVKENNFPKGPAWYKERFTGSFMSYGEASPNYSKAHLFKGVPQRMQNLLPDVKLIYLVRDPIDRIISHYTHNIADGREQRDINEALKDVSDNHYVMCSRYYWQIEQYLQYFSKEQLLVVNTRKLRDERKTTLQTIFDFIGVNASFYTDAYEQTFHQTTQKRKRGKISHLILENSFIKLLKQFIPVGLKNSIKKAMRPVVEKPKLSPDLKIKLKSALHDDVQSLKKFTGYDFDEWDI